MCGIAGFCNLESQIHKGESASREEKLRTIEKMNRRMLHRGPDSGGYCLEEEDRVVLGHRRLSIVDLSETGAQPMESHSKRFSMVFNGEIYNHRRLREKLLREEKVNAFQGTSDTEVLLELFEAYGVEEGIRLCKGMFAIALYDRQEKRLHLLRDRIGEKPLYYGFMGKTFVFASELGCVQKPFVIINAQLFCGAAKEATLYLQVLHPAVAAVDEGEKLIERREDGIYGSGFQTLRNKMFFPFKDHFAVQWFFS